MGTLRIKRGTKTALQTSPGYVPAEGELVYTTDSKEVFVGDGATTGGTPVSVSTQNLEDLGNVQALAAQNDQILVYNGSNWAATDNPAIDVRGNIYGDDSTLLVDAINGRIVGPVVTSSVTATNVVGNLTGDVTGSVTGNVVGTTTGTHFGNVVGNLDGDVNGSIFGDDSTMLVDAVNSEINAPLVRATVVNSPSVIAEGTATNGIMTLQNTSTSALADNASVGRILFRENQNTPYWTVGVTKNYFNVAPNPTGSADYTKLLQVYKDGRVQVGGEAGGSGFDGWERQPTADLEVYGNVHITDAKELLLGSMTTAQRDALTAANGMMIYNASDNKFQGYENGAWVNLV